SMFSDRPASSTSRRHTPSAVGDRQMLPRQTKRTRTRGGEVIVPHTAPGLPQIDLVPYIAVVVVQQRRQRDSRPRGMTKTPFRILVVCIFGAMWIANGGDIFAGLVALFFLYPRSLPAEF